MPSPLHLRIFGRTVSVHPSPDLAGRTLAAELALYPAAPAGAEADLTVRLGGDAARAPLAKNPSLHVEHEAGFVAHAVPAHVDFRFEEGRLRTLHLTIDEGASRLRRRLRRYADMQFSSREERAGMLFHELAMVSATAFDQERVPVHASALEGADGSVLLLGGTGGVGKTSLCIELCLHGGHRFVADDVCVLDPLGHAYPNLAYPKIYGYNLAGQSPLRRAVFSGLQPADRLHWYLHRLRGPDKVRRRASPERLYGLYSREGGPLRRYVLLLRTHRPRLDVRPVTAAEAAAASTDVIATELGWLLDHLRWHAYNRRLLDLAPFATVPDVLARWQRQLEQALRQAECLVASIPADLPHEVFRREMREVLLR